MSSTATEQQPQEQPQQKQVPPSSSSTTSIQEQSKKLIQDGLEGVKERVLEMVPPNVSTWAQDVIQKGSQYSKQLNHLKPLETVVSGVSGSVKALIDKYEPRVSQLETHPLFQKAFVITLLTLSVVCPPLAVGIFIFRQCRLQEKSNKHTTKVVLASMILCSALCFLLYLPGVLYGWLVLSKAFHEEKTVPFWESEDNSFPWLLKNTSN